MPSLFSHRRVLIVVVALLVAASQLPARLAGAVSSRPRHVVEAVTQPFTHGLRTAVLWFRPPDRARRPATTLEELQKNYDQALQLIRRLEHELAQSRHQIALLSQVPQELRLRGVRLPSVAVADWGGPRNPTLTLNRGTQAGLRVGLVAADGFSLVGRITDAGPATATVRLITAPRTRLDVAILPPAAAGPAGPRNPVQIEVADDGKTFTALIPENAPYAPGELAHLIDRDWPEEAHGLVVGQVADIVPYPNDPLLRRQIIITPIPNLPRLGRVLVVVPVEEP